MCRSDVQLMDGYFRKYADIATPITLGHEIDQRVSQAAPRRRYRRPRGGEVLNRETTTQAATFREVAGRLSVRGVDTALSATSRPTRLLR